MRVRRAVAVVPHDGNALTEIPKALFVGSAGDVQSMKVLGNAATRAVSKSSACR